jgi:hypothetical protein
VSEKLLHRILTAAYLPPGLHDEVLTRYGVQYASSLSYNHSLGDSAVALLSSRMAAGDAVRLVSGGNYAVLNAWLDSTDHRTQPIQAVLETWQLSEDDQKRLVTKMDDVKRLSDFLGRAELTPACRIAIGTKADSKIYSDWLRAATSSAISDEEAFVHLIALQNCDLFSVLVPVLIARPALRTRAFDEGHSALCRAACWTILPDSYHERATEFAVTSSQWLTYQSPVLGLLAQFHLETGVREKLMEYATQNHLTSDFCESGVRPLGSRLHVGAPLNTLRGQEIDDLLDVITPGPDAMAAGAVATGTLVELSKNDLISAEQATRITQALLVAANSDYHNRETVLIPRLREIAAKINPERSPAMVLGHAREGSLLGDLLNTEPTRCEAPAHSKVLKKPVQSAPGHKDERTKWYSSIRHDELGDVLLSKVGYDIILRFPEYFAEQLGEAKDEQSRSNWITFFDLIGDEANIPLGVALATARQLSSH